MMLRTLVLLLALSISSFQVFSQIIVDNLNDSGAGSFRAALELAGAAGGDTTIDVTVTGTISLTTASNPGFNILPNMNNLVINGGGIELLSTSTGIARFSQASNVTINGVIFNGARGNTSGAGLFLTGDNTFTNCVFRNMTMESPSGLGGALRVRNGTTTLDGCQLINNSTFRGAAMVVQTGAVVNLINTDISENVVTIQDPRSEQESAVLIDGGTINMTGSVISNTSPDGVVDIYVTENGLGTIDSDSDFGSCGGPGCPSTEPEPSCDQVGGRLTIDGTASDTTATVCTGDGVNDVIVGSLTGNTGSVGYLSTDANGVIRGFFGSNNNFSFENFANDVIYVRNFARSGDVTGLGTGQNIADVGGCIRFSNPLIITTQRVGTACDDGDACTLNDVLGANCNCAGTPSADDSDGDGVCDLMDQCNGSDDTIDSDSDGIPDGCDSDSNPAPTGSIPTMGEWLLMILGLTILVFGTAAMRQYVFRPRAN